MGLLKTKVMSNQQRDLREEIDKAANFPYIYFNIQVDHIVTFDLEENLSAIWKDGDIVKTVGTGSLKST